MKTLYLILLNFIKFNFFYLESKLIVYCSFIGVKCHYTVIPKPFSKVIIYGFGPYGEYAFIDLFYKHKILGIYDQKYEDFIPKVKSPDFVNEYDFDYVIVTVINEHARSNVTKFLKNKGIKSEKIVYLNPSSNGKIFE